MAKVYLGTSGYSYDDWQGKYYPEDLPRQDRLAFYASDFRAVELNFTYYRMPTADQLTRMVAETPEDFRFTIKGHQDLTHNREGDPAPFAQFRAALAPLERVGKLGAVLLQFPYAFRNVEENIAYLEFCRHHLLDLPLVVEFRRKDWLTQRTLELLREWEVGFCNVDMPQLPGLLPRTSFITAPVAYVRLHGRNAETWWHHDQAWERYNYSYGEQELEEWVPHLNDMADRAESLFVFANNHWHGQSVTTIQQLKMLLDRQVEAAP
jgi:uncharacterized protein YecE (DUF72 family)